VLKSEILRRLERLEETAIERERVTFHIVIVFPEPGAERGDWSKTLEIEARSFTLAVPPKKRK